MIGLGGPFWFNAFTSLSRVLQVARAVREVVQGAKPADDQQKGAAKSEGAQRPTTPTEAFDRVIAASLPASVPGNPFAPAVRRGDRPI